MHVFQVPKTVDIVEPITHKMSENMKKGCIFDFHSFTKNVAKFGFNVIMESGVWFMYNVAYRKVPKSWLPSSFKVAF